MEPAPCSGFTCRRLQSPREIHMFWHAHARTHLFYGQVTSTTTAARPTNRALPSARDGPHSSRCDQRQRAHVPACSATFRGVFCG
jgi:hypothetical protein